ncbi:MAG: selenocysteine-specific translation elongation factor [Gemmatimonadetes bacterium]|nr:selenocysteine-specific translation elongation factor [Gemmatimonadota bacterium]MYD25284.1 selenocysteine-specific translation elongation factor [Gemmatimonadota bacterium]MYJ00483.1 selenocysteine-specific translation elongation factor [Gemmatimonadota bacterium]
MSHLTIGTAGHVDHGKSALVEALTGVHPDRLKEERDRGMTIDLGFAFMPLGDGREVPIVDVPGHERFLKTMVAGVSGIRLVLFVVAADEGVMPQTVEHLGTVRYMGVDAGIVVLTKCDLVDEEWLMLVEDDVKSLVKGSFLEDAPVVRVSSVTGQGIGRLKEIIEDRLAGLSVEDDAGYFRMPVDRVFSMKGFGTVIAGTVLSGSLSRDSDAELLPAGTPLRIRGMQTHNDTVERAVKGQRVALNVSNVRTADIQRGDELGAPGYLLPTMMTDATVQCLESLEEPLKNRQRVRLHKGTSETIGRLILLDRDELAPGETGYVQLRLEKPIVAERNERFIIRGFSSMRLLGGGRFVEVYPQKNRRFRRPVLDYLEAVTGAEPDVLIERVMGHAHGTQQLKSMEDLVRFTNLNAEVLEQSLTRLVEKGELVRFPDHRYLHREGYAGLKDELVKLLEKMHRTQRLKHTLPKDAPRLQLSWEPPNTVYDGLLNDLDAEGRIVLSSRSVRLATHTVKLNAREKRILEAFEELGEAVPPAVFNMNDLPQVMADRSIIVKELQVDLDADADMIRSMAGYALDQEVFVEFADRQIMHHRALESVRQRLVAYLESHGTVRASEFRSHLGISRAHATVLLDYYCDLGVTNRESGTHRLAQGD